MTDQNNDTEVKRGGFDNPLFSAEMDLLERRFITQQVYSHLTNLEPKWSVRVGLLAPWGEGKTTLCHWIIEKAKRDGHIPVLYSPWSAKTDAELWHGFYIRLLRAFAENNLSFKTPKWRRGWKPMMSSMSHADTLKKLSEAHEIAKAGLEAVQSVFSMSRADVKELVAQLPPGKRFIVIIDDLDRVESNLIPRLLLSLRDMMDVDCFSFLLPFDEDIIAHALSQYGNSKEYGENFLEKILDYRVHIKHASEESILALFKHEMDLYCPFIQIELLDSIAKLLPQNPRKLKGLVRSLRAYENEAKRHREGEIDWRALLFGQMIRIESEAFFQAYIQDTFFRDGEFDMFDTSGASPWMLAAISDNRDQADENEKTRIASILDRTNVSGTTRRDRITKLCEAMRKSYGYAGHNRVLYALKLVDNPELLTWGEFEKVWLKWTSTKELNTLEPWIEEHTQKMGISKPDVVFELLTTISQRYAELLEKASHAVLASEHEEIIQEADAVLSFADEVLSKGFKAIQSETLLTPDIFQKFIDVVFTWIHFDGNESDKKLRAKEKKTLTNWADMANKSSRKADFNLFFNNMAIKVDRFNDKKDRLSAQLCDELKNSSGDSQLSIALSILSEPAGIRKLLPYDAGIGIKSLILNPDSELWEARDGAPGLKTLSESERSPTIQENALDLLYLIRKCSSEGSTEMRSEEASRIFESHDLIQKIWAAAIAQPLQFRRLKETRDLLEYLVSMGVDEELLDTPDWLMINADTVPGQEAA